MRLDPTLVTWVTEGDGNLWRCSKDSTTCALNPTLLNSSGSIYTPLSVAVANGSAYWTLPRPALFADSLVGGCGVANGATSCNSTYLAMGNQDWNEPAGIAVDPTAQFVYWTNYGSSTVERCNVQNTT